MKQKLLRGLRGLPQHPLALFVQQRGTLFFGLCQSYRRSAAASESKLAKEIVPVAVPQRKGDPSIFSVDEEFSKVKIDKVPSLRPVFKKDGEWIMVKSTRKSRLRSGSFLLGIALHPLTLHALPMLPSKRRCHCCQCQLPERRRRRPDSGFGGRRCPLQPDAPCQGDNCTSSAVV